MNNYSHEIYQVLINEAFAKFRYEIYAEVAREEGLHYYAKILEETARNEFSHGKEIFGILNGIGSTYENLKIAIESERNEAEYLYPRLSEQSISEGDLNMARLFKQIALIEQRHMERLNKLLDLMENDSVYKRDNPIRWKCRVCGYIYIGMEPPKKCPGCQSDLSSYEPEDFSI